MRIAASYPAEDNGAVDALLRLIAHHDEAERTQTKSYTAGAVGVLLHLLQIEQAEQSSPSLGDDWSDWRTKVFEALQRCMDVCVEKVHDYQQHDEGRLVRVPDSSKTKTAQSHPTANNEEQVAEAFEAILYVIENQSRLHEDTTFRFRKLITGDESCKLVGIVKSRMDHEDHESSEHNWKRLLGSVLWLAQDAILDDAKVNSSTGGVMGLKLACSSLEPILKNEKMSCRWLSNHIVTGGLMDLVPEIAKHVHDSFEGAPAVPATPANEGDAKGASQEQRRALNDLFDNAAWKLIENTMVLKLAAEAETNPELQPALDAIFDLLKHIDSISDEKRKKAHLRQLIDVGCAGVILHVLLARHLLAHAPDPKEFDEVLGASHIEALEHCLPACVEIVHEQLRESEKDGKREAIEPVTVGTNKYMHPTNGAQRQNEAMSVILLCLSDGHFLDGGNGKKRIRALVKDEAKVVYILLTNIIRLKYKKTQLTSWDSIRENPTRVIDQLHSLESHTHLSRLFQCLQRVTQESGALFEGKGKVTPDGIWNICDAMLILSYDPTRGDDFGEQEKGHAQQREELMHVFGDQKNLDVLTDGPRTSSDENASWPDIRMYNWSTALRRRRTIAYLLFPEQGILSPRQIPVPKPEKIFDRIRNEVIEL
jgi:hypothetical protein